MELGSNILEVKGVGEKTASLLKKLHIETVRDLIFNIPRDFVLYEEPVIPDISLNGQIIAISAYVKAGSFSTTKKGHLSYSHVVFVCGGKNIYVTLFNMPYLKKQIDSSSEYVLRGCLEVGKQGGFYMTQPKIYTVKQYDEIVGTLQPLYPLTKGLSNNLISKSVKQVIDLVSIPDDGMDDLKDGSISFADAIRNIHFPMNYNAFILARER